MENSPEVQKFIEFVKQDCKDNNIKLILKDDTYVTAGATKCSGYFDDNDRELAVATKRDFEEWFHTLIHEYSHMTQWKVNASAWIKDQVELVESETIIDVWLQYDCELSEKQKKKWFTIAKNIELDCERRVLKLIDQFNLPIDKKLYIKGANAYVYFWEYMKQIRKWYDVGNEPYNNPKIVGAMPDHFDNDYEQFPDEYKKVFDEFLFQRTEKVQS